MIKSLVASVTFPTAGVKLDAVFEPQPGITAVTGENGSGKTFTTIELCRYLLYGKKALRGAASDYKNLHASGGFTINGKGYTVVRNPKKEEVVDDEGTTLAVGAEAVTQKLIELMGYGLKVFDICNASTQKEADMFGRMSGPDRKRLIDEVVGLSANEKAEKSCRQEGKRYQMEAEAKTKALVVPVMPDKPEGYREVVLIEHELTCGRNDRATYDAISGKIPELPPKPYAPTVTSDLSTEVYDALSANQHERARLIKRKAELEKIMEAQPPLYSLEDLDASQMRLDYAADIERRGERTSFDDEDISEWEAEWAAYDKTVDADVACPNCDHHFNPAKITLPPGVPRDKVQAMRRKFEAWRPALLPNPDGVDLTQAEIVRYANDIKAYEPVEAAKVELQNLVIPDDKSEELAQWQADQGLMVEYRFAKQRYDDAYEQQLDGEAALAELDTPPTKEQIDKLVDQLIEARVYEAAQAVYAEQVLVFTRLQAEIDEALRMKGEFTKGADALKEARAVVKMLLSPKLSTIASSILSDMTHGKLSSVIVDDEMEITVNGQRLETLSGAGETVANLAIRIALGQILVARTFPVFFGDEIDSDADDVRREAVAEALVSLKSKLKQIILITHRDVEIADHVHRVTG